MAKQNADALIAEFLARGGAVKKIDAGLKALDLTDREWRLQTQMVKSDYLDRGDDFERVQQAERRHEMAREFALVGDHQAAHEAAAGMFDN
jgi:hypothetical protein